MQWSKLKSRTESMFADEVRGRVELRTTCYNQPWHRIYGPARRSWITIDGKPVVNMHKWLSSGPVFSDGHPGRFELGLFTDWDLPYAAKLYLTMSIEDAFASDNTLVRAFAVLDRRAGKRRLAAIDPEQEG